MSCPTTITIRSPGDPPPNTGGGGGAGYQGYQGNQGFQGPRGFQGYQGFQGVPGVDGQQGSMGAPGSQGPQGHQGADGINGVQGADGVDGVQGPQGYQGADGVDGIQGPQGESVQGPQGADGALTTYTNLSPTTSTVGGIPAGSTFNAQTLQQMFDKLLYPFQAPAFSSFTMSGQTTPVEVGTTISGTKTFTWGTTNSSNVQANSITIRDVTNSVNLATGLANDGSEALAVGTVQKTTATSHSWSITGTNTQSSTFTANYTVNWNWRLFYGTSTNTTLTAAQIQALASSLLGTGATRTYSYPGGGYKYLCFPSSFTAPTSFKDASNNLNVAMADSSDDASFSNTANGLSFALVSVTNSLSQTTNYRVYRTKNILGGSINIVVA